MLEAGIRGEQSVAVTSENTAKTMGSGTLDVFATPALVALAEKTCWMSVAAALDEGCGTVGTRLELEQQRQNLQSHVDDLLTKTTVLEKAPFGIVIAEALATGLPVITTTGTPWKELEENNCGWWIDATVENLITALKQALKLTSNDMQTMAEKARYVVAENYEIAHVCQKLLGYYTEIN